MSLTDVRTSWIAACRSSFLAPETRTASPWIEACTLSFASLSSFCDRLALVLRHADLDGDRLLHLVAGDLLDRAELEAAHVDVALGHAAAQHVGHLAELELVVGEHRQHQLGLLDARVRALEVEAVGDFLVGLLDRVLHFLAVDLRDDVEGGHAETAERPCSLLAVQTQQLILPALGDGFQPFGVGRGS